MEKYLYSAAIACCQELEASGRGNGQQREECIGGTHQCVRCVFATLHANPYPFFNNEHNSISQRKELSRLTRCRFYMSEPLLTHRHDGLATTKNKEMLKERRARIHESSEAIALHTRVSIQQLSLGHNPTPPKRPAQSRDLHVGYCSVELNVRRLHLYDTLCQPPIQLKK